MDEFLIGLGAWIAAIGIAVLIIGFCLR